MIIGSFFTRGLVMVFGYAYPAYECYKTIEKNKPQIEHLRFWCQYWILVAVFTVCERIADVFISWLPFYNEAKLAFFIYLWYPKTQGTTYVYDSYFRPYIAKYENDIDRLLLELRTRPGDMAILYWRWAASYGQTRVLEIFQHVSSHSTPSSRSAQLQRRGARTHQPVAAPNRQPSKISSQSAATQPESEGPLSPTSSSSSSQSQMEVAEDVAPSQVREATPLATNDDTNSPTNEADVDEAILVTPAKLRKSLKDQFETSSTFSLQN